MNKYKLAFGIVTVLTVGIIIFSVRRTKVEKRLVEVADAGYETAYDVLYPLQSRRFSRLFR